jgi:hypothetical protein
MFSKRLAVVALGLLVSTWAPPAFSQVGPPTAADGNIQITLKNKFIADYKNRVTIDADDYIIDKAHPRPNPASKDGDLHVAGRAPTSVGLAIVAEIMNAKDQRRAVAKVHDLEGTGRKVAVSGAWRLWCEHAGTTKQIQGKNLAPFDTTNPPHVFEIHPITKLDGLDITDSFKPVRGFQPKDAHDAFVTYENVRCRIVPKDDTVTLYTSMAGYNYVEFILELNEDPFKLTDGYAALCQVRDLEGELLVRSRRMLFAAGTPPAESVKDLTKGKRMHVLGLPRIDLALVDWRVRHAKDDEWKDDDPLRWNLPYEIIVVGAYAPVTEGDN